MRIAFVLAALLSCAPIVLAEQAPERHHLRWCMGKGKAFTQRVVVHGEAEEYGKEGLSLSATFEFVCTSDELNVYQMTLVALEATCGGALAVRLNYADGAWKEATIGGVGDVAEPIQEVKKLVGCPIEVTLYSGDDVSMPGELFRPLIALKTGLFLGDEVPGFVGGLYAPGYGLGVKFVDDDPETLVSGVAVGKSWGGADPTASFVFECVEEVGGAKCAKIVRKGESARDDVTDSLEGTWWFGLEAGTVVKATLAATSRPEGTDPARAAHRFTVEVSTPSK